MVEARTDKKIVTVTIDGKAVSVPEDTPLVDAAEKAGAHIPTLCRMEGVDHVGACRVCVVKVEGEDRLAASCITGARDGMVVHTRTAEVLEARRTNVELMLADHNTACTTCTRNTNCALQSLAADLGILEIRYPRTYAGNTNEAKPWPADFPLQRDSSKCIGCLRCVSLCAKVQACSVWDVLSSGSHTYIGPREHADIEQLNCALCGQCVTHCPTGALSSRDDTSRVLEAIADPDVVTVVNVAPAVRSAWGEGIGLSYEESTVGRMVSSLRAIGFDYVFDTDFTADLTIMEEGTELVQRVTHAADYQWPMFTSCCPGWVRFVKQNYPEYLPNLSTAKSPHQMLGAVAKTYFAEQVIDHDPKKVFVVSIMPCVAKKYEAGTDQLDDAHTGHDIDVSLTVREFDRLIKMCGIAAGELAETDFDAPLGLSTGAGVIFGRTGGVMEAALRSAGALITGEVLPIENCDLLECTPDVPWTEKKITIADLTLRIAVASGLGNTRQLLEALKAGTANYDFVEIMACPGGCVGGGGQPIAFDRELAQTRAQVITRLDTTAEMRLSHENPAVHELYEKFLGEPCGHLSHELLHTDQSTWEI